MLLPEGELLLRLLRSRRSCRDVASHDVHGPEIIIHIGVDDGRALLELLQRELPQLLALLLTLGDESADDAVRLAEGNPFLHQVLGQGGGIEEAAIESGEDLWVRNVVWATTAAAISSDFSVVSAVENT